MPGEYGWQRVRAGDVTISVAEDEPVACVSRPGEPSRIATWPDLDLGARATHMTFLSTSTGAWVVYRPQEAQDQSIAPGRTAAVHVGLDATARVADPLGDAQLIGATVHGLWLRDPAVSRDLDDITSWLSDDIRVRSSGGTEHRMTVDRRIAWALDTGASDTRVAVYTEPPRRSPGGWVYTTAHIPLRPGELPAEIRTRALALDPVDDAAMIRTMSALVPQRVPREADDPRASWRRARVSAADRAAAVAAATGEFANLDAYWTDPIGKTAPLTGGLRHPRVEVRGEWPDTRVEVSFWHPLFPSGRMRRTLHVFDAAGRFAPPLYASVHLMEDLATQKIPPIETAIDGILEI
jgi:hypothetical protein